MSIHLERVALTDVPWAELDECSDRTVFQGRPWLDFLAETQSAEPVVAEVLDGQERIGWFTGAVARRFGLRALGSPLTGWTTSYQGFNLAPGHEGRARTELLPGLERFGFGSLRCRHIEVMDRNLAPADFDRRWRVEPLPGWELDLTPEPADLLANTSASCRWGVRKAERSGLTVAEAPLEGFAARFHDLLLGVFERRGATVTYPRSRVQALIDHLVPAGQLLLLEVRRSDGEVAAAGIFPGAHSSAYYWGGASRTADQRLLPNEALLWAAILAWRDRGAGRFDFGGGGPFKAKFGGAEIEVAWARRSRPEALERLRPLARAVALRTRSSPGQRQRS